MREGSPTPPFAAAEMVLAGMEHYRQPEVNPPMIDPVLAKAFLTNQAARVTLNKAIQLNVYIAFEPVSH